MRTLARQRRSIHLAVQNWQQANFFSCISHRKVPRLAVSLICLVHTEQNGTEPVFGHVPLRDEEPPYREEEEQRNETSRTNDEEEEEEEEEEEKEEEEEEGGRQRQRCEEGTEPVFERSGESGSYTFTDLHYPQVVPSSAPRPPSDRLDTHPGVPPAHKLSRYTRARCTRHRRDPQNDIGCASFSLSCFFSHRPPSSLYRCCLLF